MMEKTGEGRVTVLLSDTIDQNIIKYLYLKALVKNGPAPTNSIYALKCSLSGSGSQWTDADFCFCSAHG